MQYVSDQYTIIGGSSVPYQEPENKSNYKQESLFLIELDLDFIKDIMNETSVKREIERIRKLHCSYCSQREWDKLIEEDKIY